jgi:3-hydroxyacyl-CoA dehydrogenase
VSIQLQVAATTGHQVTLVEINDSLVEKGLGSIKKSLERVAKKLYKDDAAKGAQFIQDTVGRINGSSDMSSAVAKTDIVIEAIVENMKVKHELFGKIDAVRPVRQYRYKMT